MKRSWIAIGFILLCFTVFAGCFGPPKHRIHFETGVDETIPPIITAGEESLTLPEMPHKEGHDFGGWFFDEGSFEDPFDASSFSDRPLTGDVTVYAKWIPRPYTITFDHRGGDGESSLIRHVGEALALPPSQREGYVFKGWYTDSDLQDILDVDKMPAEAFTLYARWAAYADVDVVYDPGDGFWRRDVIETFDPEDTFVLTSRNDPSGRHATLLDEHASGFRWFYKLFIAYEETQDVYRIIATDAATAAISDIDVGYYDFIVAVHDDCEDAEALADIAALASDTGSVGDVVLFDNNPHDDEAAAWSVFVYERETLSRPFSERLTAEAPLRVPVRDGYRFKGWHDGDAMHTELPPISVEDDATLLTLTAIWQASSMSDFLDMMAQRLDVPLTSDLDLPASFGESSITWESSDEDILTSNGTFQRPYKETRIVLTAQLFDGVDIETVDFDVVVAGYKPLSAPIASGYVYRGFDRLDDAFFETLDIINVAFITALAGGTLTGSHFLQQVQTHVMPRAREHGNWVVLSIAPESAWSSIVACDDRIANFADNIVDALNTYGFDGVDIDWEFPTHDEKERFTVLMSVVYARVKENNPDHLVTAAIGAGMWQPPRYDLENSIEYIDYVNMMSYSMSSNHGHYQNALYASPLNDHPTFEAGRTLISCSIDESIDILHGFNVPYEKILVGLAFYGIKQTRHFDAGSGTWSDWTRSRSVFYHDIVSDYLNHPDYEGFYDTLAGVPYIVKKDGTVFISYDDPVSVREKVAYVIDKGLGGVMYWENGTDSTGGLLAALREAIED